MKRNIRYILSFLLLFVGIGEAWGQTPKVSDGIYYIQNNATKKGYLWPSVTKNATTGNSYLTTSLTTSVEAVNQNGVTYPAHDKSYSHWVVKNVDGGYIQLINPRLNKYVVIRKFPKADNTKTNTYGDRDVWLTDEPAAEDIDYTYFKLNNNNSPYKISPKEGLNGVSNTSGYSFNSAAGDDRTWLTWSKSDNIPQAGEGRDGLIQCYSSGTPIWSFTPDLLDAPTISDVDIATNTFTITDANGLPTGYTIHYTIGDGTQDAPTATTGTSYSSPILVESDCTVKAVVVRYGVVLSEVAQKAVSPAVASPIISFDNTTNKVSISCTTNGATVFYNTGDGTQADPTTESTPYQTPFDVTTPTTVKAIASKGGIISSVSTLVVSKVATPTIQNNGSNAISITSDTEGATIYYTLDSSETPDIEYNPLNPLGEGFSNKTIRAIAVKEGMINSAVGSGSVKLQCATPVITRVGMTFTLSCSMPSDASLYYTLAGGSEVAYTGNPVSFTSDQLPMTVTAVARHSDYTDSESASMELKNGTGTSDDPYLIYGTTDFTNFVTNVNEGTTASAFYKLGADVSASGLDPITTTFTGTFDGGLYTITGLTHSLFNKVENGVVKNVILHPNATVNGNGAICNEATGDSRIYNCGMLSGTVSGSGNVGSLVGLLDGTSRVINCYSYATVSGGSMMGGIVGRNNQTSTMSDIKTIVVNCMFYGEISGANAGSAFPVYGGKVIANDGTNAINNYNYFRSEAEFDNVYTNINNYNRSWPAEEKYLTRFEYYRNILNSNRRLCTWWVNGTNGTAPSDADVESVGIAKWVLDTSIAPYPILKKWGKYPSVINPVPVNALGLLSVSVEPGEHNSSAASKPITLTITDMDEANHDYGYYKVQLPYYNELFGDPSSSDHNTRYGNNYTDMVVTGWEITSVTGGTDISDKKGTDADGVAYDHTFTANWESGYNFADRYCTEKDKFSVSGRVFAQGGYYYVPEGVTGITIKAHWGTAVYVRNKDNSIDRINTTADVESNNKSVSFSPAGTLPTNFQEQTVFNSIQNAIKSNKFSNLAAGKTVYDQAVVLVGNIQVRNGSNVVNYSGTNAVPYTLMSADFDLDNEPDFCLQLQFRNDLQRPRIQPVRFDFLSIPELGLAIRPDNKAWAIGIMVPAGHFEITETACMHTTQFEYDANISKVESPVILNGGHFEQIVVRYGSTDNNGVSNRTSYFIMGGNFWMKRFTPGAHTNTQSTPKIRHCAVNVIGGEFPEFYLSGIYRTITANVDNPHCYIAGGKFGTIAGAGMEQISGDITFKIDHAIIDEFYGGGINASLPVLGNIDVTIDHSRVGKYCGGPKVGILGTTSAYKTVTTHATGTTFGEYYGGGNGGTSYYREKQQDGDAAFPSQSADGWNSYGFSGFNPLNTISGVTKASDNSATNKGYHGEYEFEVFNNSNGTTDQAVVRAYYQWVQFGTTATGTVTNYLKDCTVNGKFYGGGNLGNVIGNVETTLTGATHITGSAFAAGYSASIPSFRIHDKANAAEENFPARDFAGVITEHTLDYKKDDSGNEIYYTWSNEKPSGVSKDNPTFQKDGKWYCYTWTSLEGLGSVSGNASLTITGSSSVDGSVFGGGDESATNGNTTVTISGNTRVNGDVFGGGNNGNVSGSTTVNIQK